MAQLIATNVAPGLGVCTGIVLIAEAGVQLVYHHAAHLAASLRQHGAVTPVRAGGVGVQVQAAAADVVQQDAELGYLVRPGLPGKLLAHRREGAFANRQFAVLYCHVGENVVIVNGAYILLFHWDAFMAQRFACQGHVTLYASKRIEYGIRLRIHHPGFVQHGTPDTPFYPVALGKDVVVGRSGHHAQTLGAVQRLQIDGPLAYGIVNGRDGQLRIVTAVAVLLVAHHDAFNDQVILQFRSLFRCQGTEFLQGKGFTGRIGIGKLAHLEGDEQQIAKGIRIAYGNAAVTGIGKRIGLVVELEFASLHLYVLYPVLVPLAVPGKHQVAGRQVGLEFHLAFAGGGALDRNDRGGRCQFRLHVSLLAQRHGVPVIVNGNHHLRGTR